MRRPILSSMLPLAHVGHYLWILYLLPVVFVVVAIVKTTLSGRHRDEEADGRDK